MADATITVTLSFRRRYLWLAKAWVYMWWAVSGFVGREAAYERAVQGAENIVLRGLVIR